MAGLAQLRHTAVIADEEDTAGLKVAVVSSVVYHISLTHTFVVVDKNGWDVDAVGAWHAILAVVAGNGIHLHHYFRSLLEEFKILCAQWLEWGKRAEIVLQMLHQRHAAEHGEHLRHTACKAERP